jgi:hypothetical protein
MGASRPVSQHIVQNQGINHMDQYEWMQGDTRAEYVENNVQDISAQETDAAGDAHIQSGTPAASSADQWNIYTLNSSAAQTPYELPWMGTLIDDFPALFPSGSTFDHPHFGTNFGTPNSTVSAMAAETASVRSADRAPPPDKPTLAISYALSTTMDSILAPAHIPEPSLSLCRAYFISLWNSFFEQIAPTLTPFGNRADSPAVKYLVPNAEKCPELLIAVLYLAQIIARRDHQVAVGVEGRFLEEKAEIILQNFDSDDDEAFASRSIGGSNDPTEQKILILSTVLIFCMAFIADRNDAKLGPYTEYAAVLCQYLFKTLAEDEAFLYLAKTLGFILNSLLFSSAANRSNAPDYLSAALEFPDRHDNALRQMEGHLQEGAHFRDLDMCTGLSASMASILYSLGTLVKRRRAGQHSAHAIHDDFIKAFELDVDGLEARLRRHLTLLTKRRQIASSESNTSPPAHEDSLTQCLDSYNEAVFWSAWTIFLTDLKDHSSVTDPDVSKSVEHILDACVEVPEQSVTAPLMLFPLVVGGMRTTKRVYREFVLNRLRSLRNVGLTDTLSLCDDLKSWWDDKRPIDSTIAFTRNIVI